MSKQRSSPGSTPLLFNQNVMSQAALLIVLGCITPLAMAAGFEAEASNMITSIRHGIYVVVGLVAGVTLVWQCALGFGGRKGWMDILETAMWVVGAGAAISFATWLFTKGGSISF